MSAAGIAALRRFTGLGAAAAERCELCGIVIGERHEHLIAPGEERVRCACSACGGRVDGAGGGLHRVVTRARAIAVELDDDEWGALGVPVAMAYFRRAASGAVAAYFPGPAGTTASPLDAGVWHALAALHPELPELEPEVEALLMSRLPGASGAYLVSIDLCFQLAGVLLARWRGLAGGEEARAAVASFFNGLRRPRA